MKLLNATPHSIKIVSQDGNLIKEIPSSGISIRLSTSTEKVGEVDGITITKTIYGQPEGLPDYKEGTAYIVSALVKAALPNRKDLFVPAEQVRNIEGQVIGCQSLGI